MKIFAAFLGCVLIAHTMGKEVVMRKQDQGLASFTFLTHITRTSALNDDKFNACPLCIDFADESIDMLEDLVLELGVIDSCALLCDTLAVKTGSQILGLLCNFFCDIEGVKEFVKAIEAIDLDDIYFCELIKGCPIFDEGDARITMLSITPVSGPQGNREIGFSYTTTNGTGTGQIDVQVITIDKFPIETRVLNQASKPGSYPFRFVLHAERSEDCNPQQAPCETWKRGNYTLIISVCNGECGSKHPHSNIYDTRAVIFTITEE